jgi:hypothetical protein
MQIQHTKYRKGYQVLKPGFTVVEKLDCETIDSLKVGRQSCIVSLERG